MDLTCPEIVVPETPMDINCAVADKTMINDPRVILNLLCLERSTSIKFDYFKHIQTDIEPFMRGVVALWMMEVCDEQHCEGQVFPLAINYMDRFLSVCPITRHQFQLLGATCLLLSSKIRQCNSLSTELLSVYTDRSVTSAQIRSFELIILTKLQWNLSAITGFDYIDHLLERLPWSSENSRIRQHAHTLVTVCITEFRFMLTLPSVLASACICSAARGLKMPSSKFALRDVCHLTNLDPIEIEFTVRNIESIIAKENETLLKQQQQQTQNTNTTTTTTTTRTQQTQNTNNYQCSGNLARSEIATRETPTDIQDVYF